MTAAVVTAIVAALLAGLVALYRERRLELQRFLVAARVVRDLFMKGAMLSSVFVADDAEYGWGIVETLASGLDFAKVWDEHRDVLAGHLLRAEWDAVARAVTSYVVITTAVGESDEPPSAVSRTTFATARDELKAAASTLGPYCDRAGWLHNPGRKATAAPAGATIPSEAASEPEQPSA